MKCIRILQLLSPALQVVSEVQVLGWGEHTISDWRLLVQVASILIAGGGSFALMKGPFPMSNFFVAGTLVYMGTIVLEGVSMSLTSKVRLPLHHLSRASTQHWVGILCMQSPYTSVSTSCIASAQQACQLANAAVQGPAVFAAVLAAGQAATGRRCASEHERQL